MGITTKRFSFPCACFCSVMSDSLWPHGLQPTRLLCPWTSPGKNSRVGCHALLQGIFPSQGSNPGLRHCTQILYCLSHQGSPLISNGSWQMKSWDSASDCSITPQWRAGIPGLLNTVKISRVTISQYKTPTKLGWGWNHNTKWKGHRTELAQL